MNEDGDSDLYKTAGIDKEETRDEFWINRAVHLEAKLASPERQLDNDDLRRCREISAMIENLDDEQWADMRSRVFGLIDEENKKYRLNIEPEKFLNERIHAEDVENSVWKLGLGRLAQIMAIGHDGIKLPVGLGTHESESAVFMSGRVAGEVVRHLVEMKPILDPEYGTVDSLGKLLEKVYFHRTNEFPEVMGVSGETSVVEARPNNDSELEKFVVGKIFGTYVVRFENRDKYRVCKDGVSEEDRRWAEERVVGLQVADISTGLSDASLEKYHAVVKEGMNKDDYRDSIFASMVMNLEGALDREAQEKLLTDNVGFETACAIRSILEGKVGAFPVEGEWSAAASRWLSLLGSPITAESLVLIKAEFSKLRKSLRELSADERKRLARPTLTMLVEQVRDQKVKDLLAKLTV